MPKPVLPIRASRPIRWVRGECRRISMQSASSTEVLPCALSPVRIAPAGGTSRSSDPKQRKSISRNERSTADHYGENHSL